MTPRRVTMAALAAGAMVAGCGDIPDLRSGGWRSVPAFGRPVAPDPVTVPPAAPTPGASLAETACVDAGRAAGFDVRGVVGTREVAGPDGQPVSRDVMLRVQRGGQSVEVRCVYAYAEGSARIMTL